ncbi:MAG: hypothetical protein GSR73_00075 [Desulfurococcales archaeon]|nr:hypothetical protein [Desulfurococcales archaeon]
MTSQERGKLPPFASGRLAGDYRPLFEYWRIARSKNREDLVEKAMLSNNDYKLLEDIVSRKAKVTALDLIDILTEKLADRIDPDIALEAMARLGYNLNRDEARLFIARLLASWLVEAGDYWRILRLTGTP